MRSRKWIGWRVRVPMNSSSRLMASLTGRRAAWASITAMKSWASMSILPPKLPPTGGCLTVMRRQSRPRQSASSLRYMNTMWTGLMTSRSPSASKSAMTTCVSMGAGAAWGLE